MKAHAILVCFTVTANDMEQAQKQLMAQLPNCKDHPGQAGLDSWYIAMNERHDGALPEDGWSAEFVDPNAVTVRLDYDDAVLLYELLRDDVCTTSLISSARRRLAAAWALEIFDAIDKFERA